MKMKMFAVLATVLFAGFAYAADADFKALDANGDGKLEKAEIETTVRAHFGKHDANGDQGLDREEFKAAGGPPGSFDALDKDKNGRISLDELGVKWKNRLAEMDHDRNGSVDFREWGKFRKPVNNPVFFFLF